VRAAMKRIVYPAIILLLTSSSAAAEWKYHLIGQITNENQGQIQDAESFINNDCKPDNWGDFSGFITQPGIEGQPYSLHLLCRVGNGKAGRVIVKMAYWLGANDFLHNTIGGFAKVTILGMSLSQTPDRNNIYFAVPE